MDRKKIANLLVSMLFVFPLLLIPWGPPAAAQTTYSISPNQLILIPGGSPAKIEAKGPSLGNIQVVQVTNSANGQIVPGFDLSLDRSMLPTALRLQITAGYKVQLGGPYQLTLFGANSVRIATIPLQVFSLTVVSKPTGMPYVTSWTPRSPGYWGSEIRIFGQDFNTTFFQARIGPTILPLTYRATNEIRARLPHQRMTGDLIVSYGAWGFEYILERSYKVIGDAVIQSVNPAAFYFGDTVTITGIDLDMAYPLMINNANFVKISDESTLPYGSDFLLIGSEGLQFNADRTEAKFKVFGAYQLKTAVAPLEISPPPQGKLRLQKAGEGGVFAVASPSPVTYRGTADMVVSKVWPDYWGDGTDFVILTDSAFDNRVIVQGRGLYSHMQTQAAMGTLQLTSSYFAPDGLGGNITVYHGTQSNPIVLSRNDGQRVTTSIIKVLPKPKFVPDTEAFLNQNPIRFALNTTYRLTGWYLNPGVVSGLTYEFVLGGLSEAPNQNPYLKYTLLSRTDSAIEFRVDLVRPLPSDYLQWTEFGGGTVRLPLIFKAKYGTKMMLFYERPYILTTGP